MMLLRQFNNRVALSSCNRPFKNWRDFREQFWIAVANDPELSKQFNPGSLAVMRDGGAPYVRESEQAGGRIKIEIHHKVRIADGGGVYNMGNLVAVTPKRHIEIHKGGK
ncbi:HNH endonuclease [Pseudomonas aeruginosa]|nr:HNH endonuclease [Pseudomonas aeruginosa]